MSKPSARELLAGGNGTVDVLDRPAEKPQTDHAAIAPDSPDRFINRELSWLDFNHRVV